MGATRVQIFDDEDIARLSPAEAVATQRDAFVALERGDFASPPRLRSALGSSNALFCFGGYEQRGLGFRFSGTGGTRLEPITVTYAPDGATKVIVLGDQFLGMRGGAIGGAGVEALARKDAARLAIIGSGRNGWWHVWATTGVRDISELSVFSRDEGRREAFAQRARDELDLKAVAVSSAREAVEGADIVILSTDSRVPVIEASWVPDGAHVSTFGPKSPTDHETPLDLLDRVSVVSTDIPAALRTSGPLFPESSSVPIHNLGAVFAGTAPTRTTEDEVTLFLLTGLGGTEVVLAQLLAETANR